MKLAFVALLAAAALAQTPENKPATVEGKVVNSVSGDAVRKADLILTTDITPEGFDAMIAAVGLDAPEHAAPKPKEPRKTFTATSDAGGKFRFEGVAPGAYYLTSKHAGFVDLIYKATGPNRAADNLLRVQADDQLAGLDVRMVPQAAAAGSVVDEDGDPITDAMVTAEAVSYGSGHRTFQLRDSGQTNDRGEFRLGKLPPGRYYVSAERMAMNLTGAVPPPPKDGLPEKAYVRTFFPAALDPSAAEIVEIKAGIDVPGLTIHLQKSRVVRVKGQAIGDDGKPLKGAQIMLMESGRPFSMRMTMVNDPDGKFELANVPPGSYTAMIMQLQNQKMIQQPLMVPDENLSDIKLGAVAQTTVRGRVNLTGDGKVALKGLALSLEGDEESMIMPVNTAADETGAFRFQKVVPARYEFSIEGVPRGAYLKSVLWNGAEKLGEAFDVSASLSGELQVFLGTDGGKVDVRVSRDDKPVADATVVLLPEDAERRNPRTARSESTDGSGHAEFADVPPGNYLAIAWETIEEGGWFDPAVIKTATKSAGRVAIDPKESQHVDLKAIPK